MLGQHLGLVSHFRNCDRKQNGFAMRRTSASLSTCVTRSDTFFAMSAFLGGGSDIGDLEDRGGVGSGLTASVGVNGEVDAVSRNQTPAGNHPSSVSLSAKQVLKTSVAINAAVDAPGEAPSSATSDLSAADTSSVPNSR
jgi:hypothetical protein